MTRDKLIALKEKALDQMVLCAKVFETLKPPRFLICEEMTARSALVTALCAELGEPLVPPEVGTVHGCVRQAIFLLNRFLTEHPDPTGNLVRVIDQLSAALPKGGAS